jgi:hypothetical protein
MLIELFASPVGQELVRKFLEATVQAQHAGLTPMQARDRAAAMVSGEENDRVLKVYNGMTPDQRRGAELFSQSSDFRRIQLVLTRIAEEFEQATIEKQTDLASDLVRRLNFQPTNCDVPSIASEAGCVHHNANFFGLSFSTTKCANRSYFT